MRTNKMYNEQSLTQQQIAEHSDQIRLPDENSQY
jgi:hypothetical protein